MNYARDEGIEQSVGRQYPVCTRRDCARQTYQSQDFGPRLWGPSPADNTDARARCERNGPSALIASALIGPSDNFLLLAEDRKFVARCLHHGAGAPAFCLATQGKVGWIVVRLFRAQQIVIPTKPGQFALIAHWGTV